MWEAAFAHVFRMPVRPRDFDPRGCAEVDPAAVEPWGPRRRTAASVLERRLKPCVWKAASKAGVHQMLEAAMFIGLGVVAFWCYLRYPRLRPRSLVVAIVHVAVSFGGFALLPTALHFLLPAMPSASHAPYVVLGLPIPTPP